MLTSLFLDTLGMYKVHTHTHTNSYSLGSQNSIFSNVEFVSEVKNQDHDRTLLSCFITAIIIFHLQVTEETSCVPLSSIYFKFFMRVSIN